MSNLPDLPYSDSVAKLLEIGTPDTSWPDYPVLYGLTAEHIPELIRMAVDEQVWEEDSESEAVYRNVHAWRALAQLQAFESIPSLVSLLHWVDDYGDDWTGEELPEVFGRLGPAAIPFLADYLADPDHGEWARVAATASLVEIGKHHRASPPECANVIAHTLATFRTNSSLLNAEMITALSDLEQAETYPLVEQAFQSGNVDISIMGDWEDFQIKVGLLEKRLTEEPDFHSALFSSLTGLSNPSPVRRGGKTEKKAKVKRKMEKQSRKKNRKKKK
jgi:hypothetical protein